MYFMLRAKIETWKGTEISASLASQLDWLDYPDLELGKPVETFPTNLIFSVPHSAPLPEILFTYTGRGMDLYSHRFTNILDKYGIPNEMFEIDVIEKRTGRKINKDYFMVNLLDTEAVIDIEKSTFARDPVSGAEVVKGLVMKESCLQSGKLMFRMHEIPHPIVVHRDVAEDMWYSGITGCEFIPASDYCDPSVEAKKRIEQNKREEAEKDRLRMLKRVEKRRKNRNP